MDVEVKSVFHWLVHRTVALVKGFGNSVGTNKVLLILQLWLLTTRLPLAVKALMDRDLAHLLLDELTATLLVYVFQIFRLALLIFHY
jgi:hypothetical protein